MRRANTAKPVHEVVLRRRVGAGKEKSVDVAIQEQVETDRWRRAEADRRRRMEDDTRSLGVVSETQVVADKWGELEAVEQGTSEAPGQTLERLAKEYRPTLLKLGLPPRTSREVLSFRRTIPPSRRI